jgi:hypothetical protein
MCGKIVDRGLDRCHGTLRGIWTLVTQKLKGAFDVIERSL